MIDPKQGPIAQPPFPLNGRCVVCGKRLTPDGDCDSCTFDEAQAHDDLADARPDEDEEEE